MALIYSSLINQVTFHYCIDYRNSTATRTANNNAQFGLEFFKEHSDVTKKKNNYNE